MAAHLDDEVDDLGLTEADFAGIDPPPITYPSLIDVLRMRTSPIKYLKSIPDRVGELIGNYILPTNL